MGLIILNVTTVKVDASTKMSDLFIQQRVKYMKENVFVGKSSIKQDKSRGGGRVRGEIHPSTHSRKNIHVSSLLLRAVEKVDRRDSDLLHDVVELRRASSCL